MFAKLYIVLKAFCHLNFSVLFKFCAKFSVFLVQRIVLRMSHEIRTLSRIFLSKKKKKRHFLVNIGFLTNIFFLSFEIRTFVVWSNELTLYWNIESYNSNLKWSLLCLDSRLESSPIFWDRIGFVCLIAYLFCFPDSSGFIKWHRLIHQGPLKKWTEHSIYYKTRCFLKKKIILMAKSRTDKNLLRDQNLSVLKKACGPQ